MFRILTPYGWIAVAFFCGGLLGGFAGFSYLVSVW